MGTPDLSFIIPAYNCEAFVTRAVQSALAQFGGQPASQEPGRVEVIVVDDASIDGTSDVVSALAKVDPRVKLLQHSQNLRQGAARNTGIRAARGEFVFFLDADDWLDPSTADHMMTLAREKKADVVAVGVQTVSQDLGIKPYHGWDFETTGGTEAIGLFSEHKIGAVSNKMYRRSLLLEKNLFFMDKYYHEDILFAAYTSLYSGPYVSISNPYYNYFLRSNSVVRGAPTRLHLESYFALLHEIEIFCDLMLKTHPDAAPLVPRIIEGYWTEEILPKIKKYSEFKSREDFRREIYDIGAGFFGVKGVAYADLICRLTQV